MDTITYASSIRVKARYDVLVAGGGPAGICAAVAAARLGASVALVERYGVLGGNLTAGHVGPILGSVGEGTMRDELVSLLGVPDNDWIGETGKAHDVEKAKLALAEFVAAEKIDVYLQCSVFDVLRSGPVGHGPYGAPGDSPRAGSGPEDPAAGAPVVRGLVIASNEAPFILLGKVIIDATGDAIVSTLAGATVFKGREDGLMQPVTLEFTIEGVDESRGLICIGDVDDVQLFGKRFLDWCREQADAGKIPPSLAAVRLHPTVHPGERQVNTTQVCGVDITKVDQIFPADLQLRRQMVLLETFLRENVPGYEKARIIASGTTTGVRESRRVLGDYLIDASELSAGCRFPDVVVHNALFIVDIHNPAGAGQAEDHIQYCKPYDLPYRCFLPKGLEGLLVTGRCISGTHRAHASYRVMSICMAMGEATGMAAALAAARGCTPRELPVSDLQSAMTARGIRLFD